MYCFKYPWALLIVLLTTHLNSDFVYRNRLRLVDSKINSFFDHFCGQWWLQLLRVTRQMRLMARTRELIPRIGRAREGCCCCCGSYLIGWSMPFKKIIKFTLTLVLYFGHTTYLPTYLPKKHWSKQVGCLSWPWLFHSLMFRSRPRSVWIFKLEIPGPLFHFTLFFSNGLKNRTIDFSKIRTRIVRVQGEYTHHMTITRSQELFCH